MKNTFFILTLFLFIPSLSYSYVKSMELFYDKNEVYKGNTFTLSFSTTTNWGTIVKSTDSDSRYNVDNFSIKSDLNIRLLKSKGLIEIYVPTDFNLEKFNLSFTDNINDKSYFEFEIPLFDFKKQVKAIQFDYTNLVFT